MAFRPAKKGSKRKDSRNGVKREKYNVPDELDLQLKQEKVDKLSKTLTEDKKAKPLTDAQIKGLFRDSVRRKWMYAPVKLSFLESQAVPDYDPNTRTRFKWRCEICKNLFLGASVEIDHKIGGDRDFVTMTDAPTYARGILEVGWDDLQVLCADRGNTFGCHSIKTHMEATGLSFEDARLNKEAIKWTKENKGVVNQRKLLSEMGIEGLDKVKSTEVRQVYFEYLKKNS